MRVVKAHSGTDNAKKAESEEIEPGGDALAAMAVQEVEGWK